MDNLARPSADNNAGDAFVRHILADGSLTAVTPILAFLSHFQQQPQLRASGKSARTGLLADISHFMHVAHGRHPGLIDHAAHEIVDDAARSWLIKAMDGMFVERAFLNKLTVTAGPIRRLTGHEKVSTLVEGQAKNFQMLATSDRKGCAAGAAIAFILDWHQTRPLLEIAALEMGLATPEVTLPSIAECTELVANLNENAAFRRAMAFGAEQTLAQQRGLWQLVVARHIEMVSA